MEGGFASKRGWNERQTERKRQRRCEGCAGVEACRERKLGGRHHGFQNGGCAFWIVSEPSQSPRSRGAAMALGRKGERPAPQWRCYLSGSEHQTARAMLENVSRLEMIDSAEYRMQVQTLPRCLSAEHPSIYQGLQLAVACRPPPVAKAEECETLWTVLCGPIIVCNPPRWWLRHTVESVLAPSAGRTAAILRDER